ncbi:MULTISPECIES: 5,6-dimethylbenzimidazole synthase [unclassified Devosia]|uniref:5,6-dimethylbenzimidazole synthase n=1 Tax=unclassified Devosia TaxID=196773 RepID=UPI0025C0296A|nr:MULTISPECIES: 5,6-dimethylbenzimidazole synthase [unclassified Devosia]
MNVANLQGWGKEDLDPTRPGSRQISHKQEPATEVPEGPTFSAAFDEQFQALLRWRRDVRRFETTSIDAYVVDRLLDAACLAPSVGYSQPWRFVSIDSETAREAVRANFAKCNAEALATYEGEKAQKYAELKLEGLREAPVQFAVFTDVATSVGHRLGRRTMPETLVYSTVMAIQNLWLSARVLGIGVGWVSILDPQELCSSLDVDPRWVFTAYLCLGYPKAVSAQPELRRVGWEQRNDEARRVLHR